MSWPLCLLVALLQRRTFTLPFVHPLADGSRKKLSARFSNSSLAHGGNLVASTLGRTRIALTSSARSTTSMIGPRCWRSRRRLEGSRRWSRRGGGRVAVCSSICTAISVYESRRISIELLRDHCTRTAPTSNPAKISKRVPSRSTEHSMRPAIGQSRDAYHPSQSFLTLRYIVVAQPLAPGSRGRRFRRAGGRVSLEVLATLPPMNPLQG